MSVTDDLKEIGGQSEQVKVQLGDDFNQTTFKGTITVDGVDLTGGYCSGVVLDWARRVLQSASGRDEKYLSYSTPNAQERRGATVHRMAKAYEGHSKHYVAGETNKIKALAVLKGLKLKSEAPHPRCGPGVPVPNDEAEMFKNFWKIPGEKGKIFDNFNFAYETAGTLTHTQIDTLINNLTGREDPQHKARSADGRHWENFAADLDKKFRQQRLARGKKDDPKKPFGNLKVFKSSPEKNYAGGGNWLYELSTNGFQKGCCTILAFSPSAGGSGHAVAVHQKGVDEFVFFDPNFGAFRYSKDNMERCLVHLFWKPMITAGKGVLDGQRAVYIRRQKDTEKLIQKDEDARWDKMGYTIFGV
jgi:hypothetical protein